MYLVSQANNAFKNGKYAEAVDLYQKAGKILGEKLFQANISLCKHRFALEQENFHKEGRKKATHNAQGTRYADSLKVAIIADEFTFNSFSGEFLAIPIEPNNWQELFEQHKPDIFFCESAWAGPDPKRRPWKGQIYASTNFKKENRTALLSIIEYCRFKGIPTVFWNKEDPTHHTDRVHDFVKTAKEFDFVFTTAAECVASYQNIYGIKQAFALPFATNPKLFNPIEIGSRSSRIVFAGSWYANHVQRSLDMEHILDRIVADGFELDLYDRNHGDPDPLHLWPDKYQRYLLPSKPHDQMPSVYKSSRFGLNFNTVTNSPTMFARRVFELMSSNTLVISNDTRGTREMFGDLIVYADREPDRLRNLSDNEIADMRARALANVLAKHTYKQRWHTILEDIGLPFATRNITLTFVALFHNRSDALSAIAWFQQYGQSFDDAQLLLVAADTVADLDVAAFYKEFNRFGVTVTSCSHASRYAMLGRYQPVETSHFVTISGSNKPDPKQLRNALLHLQYMQDYPITLAEGADERYCLGPLHTDAPLIDAAHRFVPWLQQKKSISVAYFV